MINTNNGKTGSIVVRLTEFTHHIIWRQGILHITCYMQKEIEHTLKPPTIL